MAWMCAKHVPPRPGSGEMSPTFSSSVSRLSSDSTRSAWLSELSQYLKLRL